MVEKLEHQHSRGNYKDRMNFQVSNNLLQIDTYANNDC